MKLSKSVSGFFKTKKRKKKKLFCPLIRGRGGGLKALVDWDCPLEKNFSFVASLKEIQKTIQVNSEVFHIFLSNKFLYLLKTIFFFGIKDDRINMAVFFQYFVKNDLYNVQCIVTLDKSLFTGYQKHTAMFNLSPCTGNPFFFWEYWLSLTVYRVQYRLLYRYERYNAGNPNPISQYLLFKQGINLG